MVKVKTVKNTVNVSTKKTNVAVKTEKKQINVTTKKNNVSVKTEKKQVNVKINSWIVVTGQWDKNWEFPFTNLQIVTVNHQLKKYPSVTVFWLDNKEIECEVEHLSRNMCLVTFNTNESGIISCN